MQIAYILAKSGEVCYIPEPTLCYSVGHTSISNPDSELKLYSFYSAATEMSFQILQRENIRDAGTDAYFQQRIFALTMHLFRAGCPERLPELREDATRWLAASQSLSLKNRLAMLILSNAPLRRIFTLLRRLMLKNRKPRS